MFSDSTGPRLDNSKVAETPPGLSCIWSIWVLMTNLQLVNCASNSQMVWFTLFKPYFHGLSTGLMSCFDRRERCCCIRWRRARARVVLTSRLQQGDGWTGLVGQFRMWRSALAEGGDFDPAAGSLGGSANSLKPAHGCFAANEGKLVGED